MSVVAAGVLAASAHRWRTCVCVHAGLLVLFLEKEFDICQDLRPSRQPSFALHCLHVDGNGELTHLCFHRPVLLSDILKEIVTRLQGNNKYTARIPNISSGVEVGFGRTHRLAASFQPVLDHVANLVASRNGMCACVFARTRLVVDRL